MFVREFPGDDTRGGGGEGAREIEGTEAKHKPKDSLISGPGGALELG